MNQQLTPETFNTLRRLLDRLLGLSPTGCIGDGLVATLKSEANTVQEALNMGLRPPLVPSCYKDINGGDFFLIHHGSGMSLLHQDGEDNQWSGLTDTTGAALTRPRPRSLTTGSFVRLGKNTTVEVVTREEAAKLLNTGLVVVAPHHKARVLDKR